MVNTVQIQIYQMLSRHTGPPPTVREIEAAIGRGISTMNNATLSKLKFWLKDIHNASK